MPNVPCAKSIAWLAPSELSDRSVAVSVTLPVVLVLSQNWFSVGVGIDENEAVGEVKEFSRLLQLLRFVNKFIVTSESVFAWDAVSWAVVFQIAFEGTSFGSRALIWTGMQLLTG